MKPFGIALDPPFDFGTGPLPVGLAGAIVARFRANAAGTLAGITKMYQKKAGDKAEMPYLVFSIPNAPTYYHSSTSYWRNVRVIFTVYAAIQLQADQIRDRVAATFGAGDYPYQGGYSIPFFEEHRAEGDEPARGRAAGYVYKASVEYSARCRRDA